MKFFWPLALSPCSIIHHSVVFVLFAPGCVKITATACIVWWMWQFVSPVFTKCWILCYFQKHSNICCLAILHVFLCIPHYSTLHVSHSSLEASVLFLRLHFHLQRLFQKPLWCWPWGTQGFGTAAIQRTPHISTLLYVCADLRLHNGTHIKEEQTHTHRHKKTAGSLRVNKTGHAVWYFLQHSAFLTVHTE